VPEQATFQMERALLEQTGGRAFARARVLSFRRLAHWVFSATGGPSLPPIGEIQRRLLLRLLLRRRLPDLEVFGRAADKPGFEEELARLLGEFLRQRVGADPLRAASLELEEASATAASPQAYLAAKLRDFALLLGDYAAEIRGRFVNPEEEPEHLAQALARTPLLKGAHLWVDGFASFSAQELYALAEVLAQVEEAQVCLCLDPAAGRDATGDQVDTPAARETKPSECEKTKAGEKEGDLDLFRETTRTYLRVCGLATARGLKVLDPVHLPVAAPPPRFSKARDLAHLERESGRLLLTPWTGDAPSVSFLEAASPRVQAEAVARELLRLRLDRGYRWREMAVLSRDLESDLPALLPALREHGIPCFVDQRRTLDSHPAVSVLLAAVRIFAHGWHSPDVIEFLKAGLTTIHPESIDRLENYVLEHGITGRKKWTAAEDWGAWPRRRLDEDEPWELGEEDAQRSELLSRVNRWRHEAAMTLQEWESAHFFHRSVDTDVDPASEPMAPAEPEAGGRVAATGQALAEALADLLRRLDVSERLQAWEADAREQGDWVRAEEHRQALDTILNALAELASVLGTETLSSREILEVAETALSGLRIGIIPSGLDEVLLGTVDRSRQPDLKACLVIGLAEGIFPGAHAQDPLLTDPEREALRARGCEVAPPAADRFLNESYFAYIAWTRASERLLVCRPLVNDQGEELAASPFWKQLRQVFPDTTVDLVHGAEKGWSRVLTARQWLGRVGAAIQPSGTDSPPIAGILGERLAPFLPLGWDNGTPRALEPGLFLSPDPAAEPKTLLRRYAGAILQGWVPTTTATLDEALAEEALLHRGVLSISLSQIETFTACPYQHFASYVLRVEERPEYRIELVDLGSLYHAVMNLWVGQAIRDGEDLAQAKEEDIQQSIRGLTDHVARRLKNELLLSNARLRYILDLVKETLIHLARTVVASLQAGEFRPRGGEVSFGSGNRELRPLEFDLSGGRRLRFRGRIDRVDSDKSGKQAGVCVIDYKMSERKLDLGKVYHGLDLQLGGYLLALTRSPNAARWLEGEPVAVGAFYMPVRESASSYLHPDDLAAESETEHFQRRQKRGLVSVDWLDRLESIDPGKKGLFYHVTRNKDGTIRYSASDALSREDLNLVLRHVERLLRQSGEAMLTGRVEVAPGQYGNDTPCTWCPLAPVCRIDSLMTTSRILPRFGRRDSVLATLREVADRGD